MGHPAQARKDISHNVHRFRQGKNMVLEMCRGETKTGTRAQL